MTSLILLISRFFTWSFGFFNFAGNIVNWILFLLSAALFTYWCYVLITVLGGNKDREYVSPTEGNHPYYDPRIYKREI